MEMRYRFGVSTDKKKLGVIEQTVNGKGQLAIRIISEERDEWSSKVLFSASNQKYLQKYGYATEIWIDGEDEFILCKFGDLSIHAFSPEVILIYLDIYIYIYDI